MFAGRYFAPVYFGAGYWGTGALVDELGAQDQPGAGGGGSGGPAVAPPRRTSRKPRGPADRDQRWQIYARKGPYTADLPKSVEPVTPAARPSPVEVPAGDRTVARPAPAKRGWWHDYLEKYERERAARTKRDGGSAAPAGNGLVERVEAAAASALAGVPAEIDLADVDDEMAVTAVAAMFMAAINHRGSVNGKFG